MGPVSKIAQRCRRGLRRGQTYNPARERRDTERSLVRHEKLAAVALTCLAAAGCGERPEATKAAAPTPVATTAPKDVHSYSNPAEIRVRHVDLDWDVLFDRKVLRGTATLSLERPAGGRATSL